jgi:hypothetical protein
VTIQFKRFLNDFPQDSSSKRKIWAITSGCINSISSVLDLYERAKSPPCSMRKSEQALALSQQDLSVCFPYLSVCFPSPGGLLDAASPTIFMSSSDLLPPLFGLTCILGRQDL